MRIYIARLLRHLGVLRFDVIAVPRDTHPGKDEVRVGELALVRDGGIEKWACLRCPGGCGATISLSLNPQRRPRWAVALDFWMRPTVQPSVHQTNRCGCHFWVQNGVFEWCRGGRPEDQPQRSADMR